MTDNIYGAFLTDKNLEKTGIWLDYGAFRVRIARQGGANKAFARLLEAKTRPYQRAIKTETLDNAVAERLMREVFAEAVVLSWETKVTDPADAEKFTWEKKVVFVDGTSATPGSQAYVRIFEELPDLYADIQEQAVKAANFRQAQREANAGN